MTVKSSFYPCRNTNSRNRTQGPFKMLVLADKLRADLQDLAQKDASGLKAFMDEIIIRLGHKEEDSSSTQVTDDISKETYLNAVIELLIQVILQNVEKEDFIATLQPMKISASSIWNVFEENRHLFEKAARSRADFLPHYHSLQWRVEASVASRSLHDNIVPFITMNLALRDVSGALQNHVLQATPTQLLHMTHVLEEALQEARSRRTRKLQKTLVSVAP